MHPRQMKRAPHQRLSTADIRNFARADLPTTPVAPPPQASAFAATTRGGEVRIEVTRPFAVHFPFAGNVTLSFAAGEQAVPYAVGSWAPGAAMVVVAEWPLEERRLLAMPRSLSDRYDTVLGGFDLDATGAVLAGSFWDCNLDDIEASSAPTADRVATRMADFFVDRAKDGFDDTTQVDLVREGFAEREVMQHYEAAAAIAAEKLRDTELAADRVEYNRAARSHDRRQCGRWPSA